MNENQKAEKATNKLLPTLGAQFVEGSPCFMSIRLCFIQYFKEFASL